jgi:MSHA biogenesis protein MshJ
MKQQWEKLVLRIDAMQLRERVFLFLTIIVCGLALADTLWLTPAQLAYKQATLRLSAQATELQRLRDELKSLAQPVDASKAIRDEIAEANQTLDGINQEIRVIAPLAEGGPAIEQALVEFLRRQTGLTLLSTGTAKQDLAPAAGQTPERAGSQTVLARRGLELRVAGSYAELVRYVQTLENALPTLRWGALQLKATQQSPELTLQVYVVGAPP